MQCMYSSACVCIVYSVQSTTIEQFSRQIDVYLLYFPIFLVTVDGGYVYMMSPLHLSESTMLTRLSGVGTGRERRQSQDPRRETMRASSRGWSVP